jgi:hypothetical protein
MVMLLTDEVIDEDDLWESIIDAADKRVAEKREGTATTLTVKAEEKSTSSISVSPVDSEDDV